MNGLTPRQRDCLDVIQRLTLDGVSPTFQQIGDAMGIVSKSSVHRLVHSLAQRGAIRFLPNVWRSIEVVRKGSPVPFEAMTEAINAQFFDGDGDEAAIRAVLVSAWRRVSFDTASNSPATVSKRTAPHRHPP